MGGDGGVTEGGTGLRPGIPQQRSRDLTVELPFVERPVLPMRPDALPDEDILFEAAIAYGGDPVAVRARARHRAQRWAAGLDEARAEPDPSAHWQRLLLAARGLVAVAVSVGMLGWAYDRVVLSSMVHRPERSSPDEAALDTLRGALLNGGTITYVPFADIHAPSRLHCVVNPIVVGNYWFAATVDDPINPKEAYVAAGGTIGSELTAQARQVTVVWSREHGSFVARDQTSGAAQKIGLWNVGLPGCGRDA